MRRDAIHAELNTAANTRPPRKDPRDEWIGQFVSAAAGLVGPLPRLIGTGSPDHATRWEWKPTGHPVARLVAAALAPKPTARERKGDTPDAETEAIGAA